MTATCLNKHLDIRKNIDEEAAILENVVHESYRISVTDKYQMYHLLYNKVESEIIYGNNKHP